MALRKIAALACVLAASLGAAGCADEGQPDAQPSSATASPTPTPTRSEVQVAKFYLTVDELRTDVEAKTKIVCDSWEIVPDPIGARGRASCTDGVVLSTYRDRSQAKESAETVGQTVAGSLGQKSVHVIGDSWGVNCGDNEALAESIATALKGEVLVFSPE